MSSTATKKKKRPSVASYIAARPERASVLASITSSFEPIARLTKDLKAAAITLSPNEARYLVDIYYQIQEFRKASANQFWALEQNKEPNSVIAWLNTQVETLENQIKRALGAWTDEQKLGQWAKSITGIDRVLTAGLLAHIDIKKAPTAGHIWRFAGLDPTVDWIGKTKSEELVKKLVAEYKVENSEAIPPEVLLMKVARAVNRRPELLARLAMMPDKPDEEEKPLTVKNIMSAAAKRPYNLQLKTLCWKIGESFVKVCNNDKDYYGKVYMERKEQESAYNAEGKFAEQAKAKLERFNINKSTDAYAAYSAGILPPAHIHARAKRYAVKLFLAHYHHVGYKLEFGVNPPKPYIIEHGGHVHFIKPPNFEEE